jgi:RNA polymerase sigma-70 factor (ECF subfamily)
MKPWLQRAARNTALRSEEPRNRFARWTARWLAPTPTIPASRFQAPSEWFPDHWREFPEPWPPLEQGEHETRAVLLAAIEDLPETWRRVILARGSLGRAAPDVNEQSELTAEQERAVLNRARAIVRERLAQHLARRRER